MLLVVGIKPIGLASLVATSLLVIGATQNGIGSHGFTDDTEPTPFWIVPLDAKVVGPLVDEKVEEALQRDQQDV